MSERLQLLLNLLRQGGRSNVIVLFVCLSARITHKRGNERRPNMVDSAGLTLRGPYAMAKMALWLIRP